MVKQNPVGRILLTTILTLGGFFNQGVSQAGIITVEQLTAPTSVDLTSEGSIDWAVWGLDDSTSLAPSVRKLGGSGISDLTAITKGFPLRGLGQFGEYGASSFSWTDGDPIANATGIYSGIQVDGSGPSNDVVGAGFTFTSVADSTIRTLTLHSTVNAANVELHLSLSDGSATEFQEIYDASNSFNKAFAWKITYSANSPDQLLNISLLVTENFAPDSSGNAAIQAASLSNTAAVPEPSALLLTALTVAGFFGVRARRKGDSLRAAVLESTGLEDR